MNFIGELEETVLTIVAVLHDEEAYGNTIVTELNNRLHRTLSLSAIHTTLYRLEEKGLLKSSLGGATEERGGRRKRMYSVTSAGYELLEKMREQRISLWKLIPRFNIIAS